MDFRSRLDALAPGTGERFAELTDQIRREAVARDQGRLTAVPVIEQIRALRLGAVRLPVDAGGAGFSLRDLFALVLDLAEADPNIAHILRNHFAFVEHRLRSRDAAERERWLALVAEGQIFSNASTELGTTIGASEYHAQVVTEDGVARLNGTKHYSTGSLYADWIGISAVTEDGQPISVVLPRNRAGLVVADDWDGFGQRLTGTGTTHLNDVVIEPGDVLHDIPAGNDRTRALGTFFQLYLTTLIAGIAQDLVTEAAAVLRQRGRTFTHASASLPADDPLLQQVVGELSSRAFVAKTVVLSVAERLDVLESGAVGGAVDAELADRVAIEAAQAKIVIEELALGAATQLLGVGGASATKAEYGLDRHWRNVRTLANHNPAVYKARAIGDWETNGTPLPATGFF